MAKAGDEVPVRMLTAHGVGVEDLAIRVSRWKASSCLHDGSRAEAYCARSILGDAMSVRFFAITFRRLVFSWLLLLSFLFCLPVGTIAGRCH